MILAMLAVCIVSTGCTGFSLRDPWQQILMESLSDLLRLRNRRKHSVRFGSTLTSHILFAAYLMSECS